MGMVVVKWQRHHLAELDYNLVDKHIAGGLADLDMFIHVVP